MQAVAGGALQVARSRYIAMLATCDALRAEFLERQSSHPLGEELPLRARAEALCGHDPLRSGNG